MCGTGNPIGQVLAPTAGLFEIDRVFARLASYGNESTWHDLAQVPDRAADMDVTILRIGKIFNGHRQRRWLMIGIVFCQRFIQIADHLLQGLLG